MATTTVRTNLTGLARRLVVDGLLPEEQAQAAWQEAAKNKTSFVSYLVEKKLADSAAIAMAASQEFGVPLLDLNAIEIDPETVKLVDTKLIQKHRALPLFRRGKKLFIGLADPTNLLALDEIKFNTGSLVEAIVVEEAKLAKAIDKAIEAADTSMKDLQAADLTDLDNLEVTAGEEDEGPGVGREDAEDAPVVRFVNKVLLDAINKGASDLHFEPYEKSYRVRFRLDGNLFEVASPPVALGPKITARLKVMSRMDIAERRVPQDGRIKLKLSKTRAIDFRVNSCPTLWGEKICLRILDPSSAKLGIDALGYEPFQKELYLKNLAKPYGMILVTGPTGSGKTVSLYTGINILNTPDTNICTAEDPVEIQLPGINQVNVNPKVGLTFASALKAFLRQDPDVILVGEIRDLETAEIAIKAAQTGHLVLSTLHTNDAPKTLTRLVDMGVPPYSIATSVNLIIAQRLARRLCNHCKRPVDVPKEALLKEGFTEEDLATGFTLYEAVGCENCKDGYKGRVGIYQVMPVTEEMGRCIMAGGNSGQIADIAAKDGVWDLRRSALAKVMQGLTSLSEANAVTIAD
ncbi:MAG TPA: type IV-A pilus assembly ATPase PilB [Gammaproteobacteria bacterium]|nr:type IV-A pilus assembly ATPase PilB [Gammaproteobacteria bacterium]